MLTMAAALIPFGRGHWHRPHQNDLFPSNISGLARPIDGDSLWVGSNEVRLQGIDAPEWSQTCQRGDRQWNCGEAARGELARAIGEDRVSCKISERDVYGRLLGRCIAGGRDLNSGMVISGMAVAYGGYRSEEAKAKTEKRGIWAGEFDEPRKWRAKHNSTDAR
jgi:endonuclease YncB( thermonuclease family)